jgi:hypothetical protein
MVRKNTSIKSEAETKGQRLQGRNWRRNGKVAQSVSNHEASRWAKKRMESQS